MEDLLQMQPSSIVALFQTDKQQRATFVTMLIDSITSGKVDPLQIHLQVKCMEDIIAQLKDAPEYKQSVLSAAEANGKSFAYQSAKVDIREVGTKYDYSQCNDTEINELTIQVDALNAKLKARQKFLQQAPIEGVNIVDVNGEVKTVYPPAKSSTTSVVVTLK